MKISEEARLFPHKTLPRKHEQADNEPSKLGEPLEKYVFITEHIITSRKIYLKQYYRWKHGINITL